MTLEMSSLLCQLLELAESCTVYFHYGSWTGSDSVYPYIAQSY